VQISKEEMEKKSSNWKTKKKVALPLGQKMKKGETRNKAFERID